MESIVRELENRLTKEKKTDYNSIDKIMRDLCEERDVTPEDLHHAFKREHGGKTPDQWIKENITEEMIDDLFSDPLQDLWDLYEDAVPKPALQDAAPSSNVGPNTGNYQHPVTQKKNKVGELLSTGMQPTDAHQEVYGEVDPGSTESKASLAATLGRVQDDSKNSHVKVDDSMEPSILARDAEYEKAMDQVTKDDLRSPMNQQVPDREQVPADQMAEEVDSDDDLDYNDDVAYLQKFGRA